MIAPLFVLGLLTQESNYTEVLITTGPTAEKAMILVPKSYSQIKGAPVIMYHHGVGEDERALLKDRLKQECVKALLDAGYILCGSNAHGNNWGSVDAQLDYMELHKYMSSKYKVTRVCFWSQSMGGMSGLLSLRNIPKVQGWLGTYPVADIADLYKQPRFQGQIEAAFEFKGQKDFPLATNLYNPIFSDMKKITVPRVRFYASPEDTVVPKATNTDPMSKLFGKRKENVVITCRGEHGDSSHFVPKEYVDFFNRCR